MNRHATQAGSRARVRSRRPGERDRLMRSGRTDPRQRWLPGRRSECRGARVSHVGASFRKGGSGPATQCRAAAGERSQRHRRLRAPFHPSLKFQPNVLEIFDMPIMTNFCGIIPAIAVPFRADYSVDEPELRRFAVWLAQRKGVVGLMTNGHTGEVFSLTTRERAEVTRITADAVKGICPVLSSIVCEGIAEAIHDAHLPDEAGPAALDIMPPHHWCRCGYKP